MLCLVCGRNEATKDPFYGIIPCTDCQERRKEYNLPHEQVELTTQSIKDSRKEYTKSTLQPFREGELSKEYTDTYGTKGISVSEKEVKKAKKVWPEATRGIDLEKTK